MRKNIIMFSGIVMMFYETIITFSLFYLTLHFYDFNLGLYIFLTNPFHRIRLRIVWLLHLYFSKKFFACGTT